MTITIFCVSSVCDDHVTRVKGKFKIDIKYYLNPLNESHGVKLKLSKLLNSTLLSEEGLVVILKEERRLRVFENRMLRRIFWPKKDANRERRRLHGEELHNLYRSPNIIRVIKSRRLR